MFIIGFKIVQKQVQSCEKRRLFYRLTIKKESVIFSLMYFLFLKRGMYDDESGIHSCIWFPDHRYYSGHPYDGS